MELIKNYETNFNTFRSFFIVDLFRLQLAGNKGGGGK